MKKHDSCKRLNGVCGYQLILCTFCGPCVGVWLVSRVLLVSWRTLLEPPALYFFPRRRLTKNSLEEALASEGLDCLVRRSLFHFWAFNTREYTVRTNTIQLSVLQTWKKDVTEKKFLHLSCQEWVSLAPGSPCCVFCSSWASLLKTQTIITPVIHCYYAVKTRHITCNLTNVPCRL